MQCYEISSYSISSSYNKWSNHIKSNWTKRTYYALKKSQARAQTQSSVDRDGLEKLRLTDLDVDSAGGRHAADDTIRALQGKEHQSVSVGSSQPSHIHSHKTSFNNKEIYNHVQTMMIYKENKLTQ